MINNRQAGRRRGRGGNGGNNNGGGGAPRQGGQGRSDNGNRIDSRARGNATQLLEKYKNLAADAQRQGDRVNIEYYLQFADHYFRVIADQRGRFEDNQPRRQQADFDGDDDYGDEGEPIRAGEQSDQGGDRQERSDRQERFERPERQERYERPERVERPEQPRDSRREDGNRTDGSRTDGNRADGNRADGNRAERPERPRRWERDERPRQAPDAANVAANEVAAPRRADPPLAGEDLQQRAEAVLEADAPLATDAAPRRRGRPRRDAQPVVEADSNGVDADRLPPPLGIAAANDPADGEDAPKPRRRRVRATGEASAG